MRFFFFKFCKFPLGVAIVIFGSRGPKTYLRHWTGQDNACGGQKCVNNLVKNTLRDRQWRRTCQWESNIKTAIVRIHLEAVDWIDIVSGQKPESELRIQCSDQATGQMVRGSSPGMGKRFLSSLKYPDGSGIHHPPLPRVLSSFPVLSPRGA